MHAEHLRDFRAAQSFYAVDLLGGIVCQTSRDFPAGLIDNADRVALFESSADGDDSRGQQAFAAPGYGAGGAFVDGDSACRPGCLADPAPAA